MTFRRLLKYSILCCVPQRVAPRVLRGYVGVLRVAFLLDVLDSPCEVVVLELLRGCVEDDVGLCAVPHTSSFSVLAGGVDGVDNGVGQNGIANDRLVVHQPNVDDATVGLDEVVGVYRVTLKHELSSVLWCHL